MEFEEKTIDAWVTVAEGVHALREGKLDKDSLQRIVRGAAALYLTNQDAFYAAVAVGTAMATSMLEKYSSKGSDLMEQATHYFAEKSAYLRESHGNDHGHDKH